MYVSMHIDIVPNRNSPPAVLLRESFRDGKKVKKRTLANLSSWPMVRVEALRQVLRGASFAAPALDAAFDIVRSRPHGHVAAILGMITRLRLADLLGPRRERVRDICVALVAARLLAPGSKLATARGLDARTCASTLGEQLGVASADEDDLYAAMDHLLAQQSRIEDALAARHLRDGTLVLYDVSSTYFEGRTCPLAKIGHSRDGVRGSLQIVFGLLTDGRGCPVAVEVFDGNTADPKTVGVQLKKLRERFHLERVVLVGDRGMLTEARLREDLRTAEGIDWITALRAPAIAETSFAFARNARTIAEEAALDGIYVVRTSVERKRLSAEEVVRSYKRLAAVERAFRSFKTMDLHIRPIHHHKADRVRAHVLVCMLAYYVEWHMRRALAPLLFDDDDREGAEKSRASVVAAAERSPRAERKAHSKHTVDGQPVHSFQSLLKDLATIVKNRVQPKLADAAAFDLTTKPTALQRRALQLLATAPM